MKKDLQQAHQLAAETSLKVHQRNKRLYDQKVKPQTLAGGDRLLIRNLACIGKHKLKNRWNSLPYVVIEKFKDLPVYKLRLESGMGGIRTLHRDHLLPIGDNVRFSKPGDSNQLVQPPGTRAQTVKRRQRKQNKDSVDQIDCESQELLESEDDDLCYYRPARISYQRPISPPRALEPETVPLEVVPELIQECAGREDLTENDPREILNLLPEVEEDLSLEGGEDDAMNVPPGEPVPMVCRKSQREVRPVIKPSYDELGHPADRPLTLVHRGMVVHIEEPSKTKKVCHTVWCHLMAQCPLCVPTNPCPTVRTVIQS